MMEELVEIINQLQDVFSSGVGSVGIYLPQIVVVGTQSAGKSSVLEQIVGKSFLPRGTGIVTRCPLVLQLVNSPGIEEYAVFQHSKQIFTDYDLIRDEIEAQTYEIAGENKGICQTSINLKICSPSLMNLTLVDLPGLTKVPVGDQPQDIEKQIRELILVYIKNPNSLILAVTPANVDMATSDSIKLAKLVDPEGLRTLAVLTKLDLMDEGTDAWDVLHGKIIPVKLGIIGVVNRSQKDINDGKTVEDSLRDEAEFLQKKYRTIAASHGSPFLTKTVQAILVSHIRKCMPELRERISQKLYHKKKELDPYSKSKLDNPTLLLNIIFKFRDIYTSAIKGYKVNIQTDDLYGGARIHSVFQDVFSKDLRGINPLIGLTEAEIIMAINNANGMYPAIFVPEMAFELLARRQVDRFRHPSLKCVELVHGELLSIAQNCLEDVSLQLNHFPKLKSVLCEVVTQLLQSRLPVTNQAVESFMDMQVCHINTCHPDFLPKQTKTVTVIHPTNQTFISQTQICINLPTGPSGTEGEDGKRSVDYLLVMELIKSYFSIILKIVEDTVPKMIILNLVNFVVEQLQVELVKQVYDAGDAQHLLMESTMTINKRNDLEAEIATLEKADMVINNLSVTMMESTKILKSHNHMDLLEITIS